MFDIGDRVVYPMHGAGVIESIEERQEGDELQRYYIIRLPMGDMKVMIPIASVDVVGLRGIIPENEVNKVFEVLSSDSSKMSTNWNRRYRANMEKIKTGSIYEVAEVVRNLSLRDREKGLSTGERKMLENARQILLSELALAKNMDEEKIEELVEGCLS